MEQYKHILPDIKTLGQIACANWRTFASTLTPIDSPDVTWFYVTKDNDQKNFTASNGHSEVRPYGECETVNGSQWLVLTLLDEGWDSSTRLHPLIAERFGNIIEVLKTIPGLSVATIHCLGKGVDITPHNDGTDDRNRTTLISIFEPDDDIRLYVNGNSYNPKGIFSFNSFLPHAVKNTTNEDWVYFVLRIAKEQYVID